MEVFAQAIQDYKCTRGHLVPPIVLGVIANEQLRWRRECWRYADSDHRERVHAVD